MHYHRWSVHGDPLFVKTVRAKNGQGIKWRTIDGKNLLAHQIAYLQHRGEIPRNSKGDLFHIHHKDGDHSNNAPDNLVALTRGQHTRTHYTKWTGCQVEDCESKSGTKGLCRGYCPAHYWQMRKHGKIISVKPLSKSQCSKFRWQKPNLRDEC